jgi:hypothetical protein
MTARHGQVPLAETSPNGRHPAGSRPGAPGPEPPEDLAERAAHLADGAEAALGAGPFTGIGLRQAAGAVRFAGRQAVRQPRALARAAPGVGRELLRIGRGTSQIAPEKGDRRFTDPAWQENRLFRTTMQTYLYLGSGVDDVVSDLGVEGMNAERARFVLTLIREALAPTNFFLTNPAALKRCFDTGGGSVRSGITNWAGGGATTVACPPWLTAGRSGSGKTSRQRLAWSFTGPRSSS